MTIAHTDRKIVRETPIEQETWDSQALLAEPRFCDEGCKESYGEDRKAGLIYGSILMEFDSGNERIVGHHDGCRWTHRCPYCGTDVPESEPTNE